jgi:hypothetical protein
VSTIRAWSVYHKKRARRIEARAISTAALSSNTPSPNKTPRKKTRSSGYCQSKPFSLDIPALQQNYGDNYFQPPVNDSPTVDAATAG